MTLRSLVLMLVGLIGTCALVVSAQRGPGAGQALDPLVGVTTDGTAEPALFAIRSTGVSTRPVMEAAERFVASSHA
jgi:hypothetical protein